MEKQNKFEKLTDKAFSRLMVTSLLGIFICIIALCSVTWAWFSTDIVTPTTVIHAGNYSAELSMFSVSELAVATADDTTQTVEVTETPITPFSIQDNMYKYTLDGNSPYKAKISYFGNGYCKIYVDGVETIYANLSSVDGEFDFDLKLSYASEVTFELRWGTYSGDSAVTDGGTLTITVPSNDQNDADENGAQASTDGNGETPQPTETTGVSETTATPEVTEPEVTEPEVTEPEVTKPEVTEPEVTEPEVTEPEVTEPETIVE